MDKWERWGSFANWQDENYDSLMAEYNSDDEKFESLNAIEPCGFDDFCMGKWQRL